jgi:hypothetical protein
VAQGSSGSHGALASMRRMQAWIAPVRGAVAAWRRVFNNTHARERARTPVNMPQPHSQTAVLLLRHAGSGHAWAVVWRASVCPARHSQYSARAHRAHVIDA